MKQLIVISVYAVFFYPLAACAALCAVPALFFAMLAYCVDFFAHTIDEVWK